MTKLSYGVAINRFIAKNLKNRPNIWLRLCSEQYCSGETLVGHRLQQYNQIVRMYTKRWHQHVIKGLFHRFRRQVQRHARGITMFASATLYNYNWDTERITYASIQKHFDELNFIMELQKHTIICAVCNRRKIINSKVEGVEYCACQSQSNKSNAPADDQPKCTINEEVLQWQPYLERKNMVIWRKEERPGLFAYKVYATYPDITAEDFLFVQTDVDYRKLWDKTAIKLEVVDTDPVHKHKSHVIYWEMLWPKLFANRDYVFNRRYFVDRLRKVIVIVNKSVEHHCCPVKSSNQRVKDYWSYMVIKPTISFKKPGLEYVLTYFDNPGVILPPAITSWVAQKQMPDFLTKLYQATLEYSQTKVEDTKMQNCWSKIPDPGFEYPPINSTNNINCEDTSLYIDYDNDEDDRNNNSRVDYDKDDDTDDNKSNDNYNENAGTASSEEYGYFLDFIKTSG